ncbi:MAG: tRNA (N6-isopentenyl adenosine(37)-C2)-methylthiotransferase MiaB [Chloroflexi bacterium]|jgi:tRNA-2-methylthio-N6-dimethylallyladenosine synthase|nr:tRNA (N6-isopentenyl adenosine(37)-C2)-methylthiotransferase MiaB [Chloroflexota bacterium]
MKYHIWTTGCQMNVADSDRLSRALGSLDFQATDDPAEAGLIILNTCVVRQSAEDRALGRLNSLKPLKHANPDLIIGLMGCLVGIRGNQAMEKRYPWVDIFAGPSDPEPFLRFLGDRLTHSDSEVWRRQADEVLDAEFGITTEAQHTVSENLPIVLGCSHNCTYCVIPNRRGRERSRESHKILAEARVMVEHGAKELVLLGQIVDRYGLDLPGEMRLPQLLREISEIGGLERIRFLTSHPNWMTDELIDAVAELPKVMPHIEVPVQAGDDEVLRAMRRGYTNQQYRDLVSRIRDRVPGASIGTDIIVGFPGETEAAFEQTYRLLEDLKIDVAHLARYSPRPNTYSAKLLPDNVSAEEKMRRFRSLEDLQKVVVGKINEQFLGQIQPILFESRAKNKWRGRTPTNRLVFVENEQDLVGELRDVRITWTGPWSLQGELLG